MWFGDNIPAVDALEELARAQSSLQRPPDYTFLPLLLEFLETSGDVWQCRSVANHYGVLDAWYAVRWIGFSPARFTIGKQQRTVQELWATGMPAAFEMTMGFDPVSSLAQNHIPISLKWLLWATQPALHKLVIEFNADDAIWVLAKDPWSHAFEAQKGYLNTRVLTLEECVLKWERDIRDRIS